MTANEAAASNPAANTSQVAVLVVSCDKYCALWEPFFTFLDRYWPDCPYPVFLLTNHKQWSHRGVTTLRVGPDVAWSNSLRLAVERMDVPYVLTIQDDFLLEARVSTPAIVRAVNELQERGGAYLRLVPTSVPWWRWMRTPGPVLCISRPHAPYRISNQASVWDSRALLRLLRPGESPWEMEVHGSERSSEDMGTYFSATSPLLRYHGHGAVIRGKWSRRAARRCRKAGVWGPGRPVESILETWRQAAVDAAFNIAMALAPYLLWRLTLARYGAGIRGAERSRVASAEGPADPSAGPRA